jgi:hypothetical protein
LFIILNLAVQERTCYEPLALTHPDTQGDGAGACARISWIVPSKTTWPARMTVTSAHSSSTSAMLWLLSRTVRPLAVRLRMRGAHVPHAGGVQPVRRLVDHQQPRVAQQRGGDPQPLAHAERVATGLVPAAFGGAGEFEGLIDSCPGLAAEEHRQQGRLAAAFGPSSPCTVPALTRRSIPSTAILSPNRFIRPRMSTASTVSTCE